MTDMNREELIARATEAIYRSGEPGDPDWDNDTTVEQAEHYARAALTVYSEAWSHERTVNIPRAEWERLKRFEQAHTPTDDEREALAVNYCPEHGDLLVPMEDGRDARSWRCQEAHSVESIRRALRRTVQGEPTDAPDPEETP